MMQPRRTYLLALALSCTACYDFVEPDFPEAGAPALLQLAVYVDESGNASITGLLAPGLSAAGVQRRVLRDTIELYGLQLAPVGIRRNGSREYALTGIIAGPELVTRPLEIEAPTVEKVAGPPPTAQWFGVRKVGPDTIAWRPGTDLVLRVASDLGASTPMPTIRQWFVALHGATSFRISADGLPPDEIVIPAYWVPEPRDGLITASLAFFQSVRQQAGAGDYIGLFSFNVELRWVVQVIP